MTTLNSAVVNVRVDQGKPYVQFGPDLHAYVGPICRSLGNRIEFEQRQKLRPADDSAAILLDAADRIDDWREAHDLETSRAGTFQHDTGAKAAPVHDGLEIVHYAAKELAESRGGSFTLTEGESGHEGSVRAMQEVQLVLDAAARARRK